LRLVGLKRQKIKLFENEDIKEMLTENTVYVKTNVERGNSRI
jgi:hypothetical protein